MALLDQLDRSETDALWWRLQAAANETADEIARLARCRASTRRELYGPGILEATVGVLADLEDVLEIDLALYPRPSINGASATTQPEV